MAVVAFAVIAVLAAARPSAGGCCQVAKEDSSAIVYSMKQCQRDRYDKNAAYESQTTDDTVVKTPWNSDLSVPDSDESVCRKRAGCCKLGPPGVCNWRRDCCNLGTG